MIPSTKRLALSLGLTLALGGAFVPLGCGGSSEELAPAAMPAHSDGKVPDGIAQQLRACAAERAARLGSARHSISFDVTLASDGQVDSVSLGRSTLGDPDLEACMAGALRSLSADDLRARRSENGPRGPVAPESRALVGQAEEIELCLASPPCLLTVGFLAVAAYIVVEVVVHPASQAKPKPQTAPITTTVPTTAEWSDYPECNLQYDQDTAYCNRFSKKQDAARCRANRSERLAYCIKTEGQTGHPPRYRSSDD